MMYWLSKYNSSLFVIENVEKQNYSFLKLKPCSKETSKKISHGLFSRMEE